MYLEVMTLSSGAEGIILEVEVKVQGNRISVMMIKKQNVSA